MPMALLYKTALKDKVAPKDKAPSQDEAPFKKRILRDEAASRKAATSEYQVASLE